MRHGSCGIGWSRAAWVCAGAAMVASAQAQSGPQEAATGGLLATSAFSLADAPAATASNTPPPEQQPERPRVATADLKVRALYDFPSSFKGAPGEAGGAYTRASVEMSLPVFESAFLGFSLSGEGVAYQFDGATGFAAGQSKPWDFVQTFSASARIADRVGEQVFWYASLGASSAGEVGAEFEDTLTYGGVAGVNVYLSRDFSIGAALTAGTQLEDDFRVFPILSFDWQINKEWNLYTTGRDFATGREGAPSIVLDYTPREDLAFWIAGGYRSIEFRLDDDGASPGGVGRDRRVPVSVGVRWKPEAQIELSGFLGSFVWGRMRLDDAGGTRQSQAELDPSLFFGFGLNMKF